MYRSMGGAVGCGGAGCCWVGGGTKKYYTYACAAVCGVRVDRGDSRHRRRCRSRRRDGGVARRPGGTGVRPLVGGARKRRDRPMGRDRCGGGNPASASPAPSAVGRARYSRVLTVSPFGRNSTIVRRRSLAHVRRFCVCVCVCVLHPCARARTPLALPSSTVGHDNYTLGPINRTFVCRRYFKRGDSRGRGHSFWIFGGFFFFAIAHVDGPFDSKTGIVVCFPRAVNDAVYRVVSVSARQ